MADVSHLERMGRELKCPICLSLLNSAVSLTCNHVFCNSCIGKSMKSASNCPVCKVPYMRREIRPAPHMDNLVNVYKSMEVASGVNIFVTQNASSTKISGEDNQKGVDICEAQDNGEAQLQTVDCENLKQRQRKGSRKASISNQRDFGLNSIKPSFPTKKRIQVPQRPTSGTHMQPEKLEGGIEESKPHESSIVQKDTTSTCEKREPILSPFFWLREEVDIEKSSQQTDGDQEMYTPPETPRFSDIKDSDDDTPSKISPDRGALMLPNAADFIDSEMFDWTQRPCSPELCSSTLVMQVEGIAEHNEAQDKAETASTEATTRLKIRSNGRKGVDKKRMVKTSDNKCGMKVSKKRVSNATEHIQKKRMKRNLCEVTAAHIESAKVTDQDMQDKSGNKDKMLNLRGKNRKTQKVSSESIIPETEAENILTPCDGTVPLAKSNGSTSIDFSASENGRKTSERSSELKKSVKSSNNNKVKNGQQQKAGGKVKAGNVKTVNDHLNEEQSNEVLISHSNNDLLPLSNDKEVSDKETTRSPCERKCKKMSKTLKKVKFSVEIMSKGNCKSLPTSADDEAAVSGQVFQEYHCTIDQSGVKVPAKLDKAMPSPNDTVLRKCNTFLSTIHCAFCQSSEESEASGTMVHYLNGKLVVESNEAVHVHKYCTEWAPNAYFEDDNVVNLENELSRSRRIRCSCCGKKGAALGCYEKSCRKSFHVPCARLTPECRWDYENFVMLCPIHASCQLPNEITKSQSKQKRRCATESKSHDHQAKATDGCKGISTLQRKSQKKFKNLVLCCSALTNTEKEIVNKFENFSGVTIMKNWDSSVTYVIASTDENGACRRTLKFLMGVLEGKWILSVQWLKACMEAGELVDEQLYEIAVDIHGIKDGPRLGRLRLLNKQPKLFDGRNFFFMDHFAPSYKGYLHDLVIAGGGKVLNRKPVVGEQGISTFIIYSVELPEKCRPSDATQLLNARRDGALAVANSTRSVVASNSWILNSIAGYKLQNLGE